MKPRFCLIGWTIVGPVAGLYHTPPAAADPPASQFFTVSAETPSVTVSPHEPGRQFVELPVLEYSFDVEARCNDDWVPESLSLSVADSHIAFGEKQLTDGQHRQFVLRIPRQQLAPVAMHDFCQLDPDDPAAARPRAAGTKDTAGQFVTVKAVLSAHASLLCRQDTRQSITYLSQPLDVTLECASGEPSLVAD